MAVFLKARRLEEEEKAANAEGGEHENQICETMFIKKLDAKFGGGEAKA